ncbi:DNA helicase RecQ [Desulforamulus ruminis]|uniref:DNA helicase RecQ n=1 Tax=Desulforamulus ruminis (strain ATCC 23193 / DSM 2154 / NCIMB 8452 / DL) TaxID=696281 RepID=F6DPG4_DESRL|nr:DNA helicase RecQ [Desulforamulus ruminis]AEG58637.1 ATP-dependent DNA helicase RecQ [Desulforamulus ruminis DSM 2154]
MLQKAREILKKYYGYSSFRSGQEEIINRVLQGKDTLGIMPTGGGKSICYQVPALLFPGTTLVISPLISLMKDQVDALHSLGIPAAYINSSLDYEEAAERIRQAGRGRYKLLYVAPERLEAKGFLARMQSLPISLVAVDEAHCVSQWGHDFRTSYLAIAPFIQELPRRPVVTAFTATATEEVTRDMVRLLSLKEPRIYITGFNRENLTFSVIRGENKRDFLTHYLANHANQAGIIYAATRKEVDNLHHWLKQKGHAVGKYHAGLGDQERAHNQEMFLYDDIRIMVATNAFGMGIDKSNVRYVIHYNMPKNMEAYYQEAGRAGRDGEPGQCILLFGAQDIQVQKFLIEQSPISPERKTQEYKKLQGMVDYCHTTRCLRQTILKYFGEETVPEKCGNCSNCNDNSQLTDITVEAQKIFSCIWRMKEQYGASLVADVLKGSQSKRVKQYGFHQLSTYGLLKEYTVKQITDLIHVLIAEGYLFLTESQYPVVQLLPKAFAVLKGQEKVLQKIRQKEQVKDIEDDLFEKLRSLRKELSQRNKVPPYIIFPDSTLREMSQHCPADQGAMLAIKGVGQAKFQQYGQEFLKLIQQYVQEKGISLEKERASSGEPDQEKEPPSHVITWKLLQKGYSLPEIARERNLKPVTIQDHLIRCGLEGYDIPWDTLIPQKYEALILQKIEELGADKLKPLKEQLPDEVDYMAIKAVLCKHKVAWKIGASNR